MVEHDLTLSPSYSVKSSRKIIVRERNEEEIKEKESSFLELKNQLYVNEWNNRVLQPQRYSPSLYEVTINYDPSINYGYEVNYLIYNYMIFFQNTYKQKLYGYVPLR